MNIKEMLSEEFERELELLQDLDVGTEEYSRQAKIVTDIADRIIAFEKMEAEDRQKTASLDADTLLKTKQIETDEALKLKQYEMESADRVANRIADEAIRRDQLKEDKWDHIVKNCITVVTFGISAALTIWGAKKSWEFEKDGTITSIFGKMFMRDLHK